MSMQCAAVIQTTLIKTPVILFPFKGAKSGLDPYDWGESEFQANDRILVDEIIELQPSDITAKVYSGVAKGISRLDQPK